MGFGVSSSGIGNYKTVFEPKKPFKNENQLSFFIKRTYLANI
jgi:hypothetical protein